MLGIKNTNKIGRKEYNNKQAYFFLAPYLLLFMLFIIIPIVIAIGLSFTNFNTLEKPDFVGFLNYINLLTQDEIFMQYVLPNTVTYALIVGPGDQMGYINAWLIRAGIITDPIRWFIDVRFLLPIMIIVALWSSMGVGFLAILAGILNSDESLYEAAAIDGVKNRFQEMIYITIPTMKPQMLFAAVMTIVGAFQNGAIGVQLAGANPTPGYAGQLIVNHIEDYGFIRYEMGYASAVSVVLLGIVYLFSAFSKKLFAKE